MPTKSTLQIWTQVMYNVYMYVDCILKCNVILLETIVFDESVVHVHN